MPRRGVSSDAKSWKCVPAQLLDMGLLRVVPKPRAIPFFFLSFFLWKAVLQSVSFKQQERSTKMKRNRC